MTDWPEVLRSFRQRNQLKQEAAASLLGVSQAYVSKVENGAVQPSQALLRRLNLLNREPRHRPTLGLFKSAVRHSPSLTCLLSRRGGKVYIEEASRCFTNFGHPFDQYERGNALTGAMSGPAEIKAFMDIANAGASEGRFGLVEAVFSTAPREGHPIKHFRAVCMPLRSDQGDWLLQATLSEISEKQRVDAETAWGGVVRAFDHDVDPPYDWP